MATKGSLENKGFLYEQLTGRYRAIFLCVALSAGKTKITICQSEAVYIMYGASMERVWSRYGAGLNLGCKENEDN